MTEKLTNMQGEIGARRMSLLQRRNAEGNGSGHPGAQRSEEKERAGASGGAVTAVAPNPELIERSHRRRFSAEYKLRILTEAEGASRPGEVGALLRREGLYSSHLSVWRRQRDEGAFLALSRPRGRTPANPLLVENADLRRRLTRTEADLATARRVIEVQGNVSALLGELLTPRGATPDTDTE